MLQLNEQNLQLINRQYGTTSQYAEVNDRIVYHGPFGGYRQLTGTVIKVTDKKITVKFDEPAATRSVSARLCHYLGVAQSEPAAEQAPSLDEQINDAEAAVYDADYRAMTSGDGSTLAEAVAHLNALKTQRDNTTRSGDTVSVVITERRTNVTTEELEQHIEESIFASRDALLARADRYMAAHYNDDKSVCVRVDVNEMRVTYLRNATLDEIIVRLEDIERWEQDAALDNIAHIVVMQMGRAAVTGKLTADATVKLNRTDAALELKHTVDYLLQTRYGQKVFELTIPVFIDLEGQAVTYRWKHTGAYETITALEAEALWSAKTISVVKLARVKHTAIHNFIVAEQQGNLLHY